MIGAGVNIMREVLTKPLVIPTGRGLFNMLVAMARLNFVEALGKAEILVAVLLLALPMHRHEVTDQTFFAILLRDHEIASNLNQLSTVIGADEVLEFETALQLANSMDDDALTVVANLIGTFGLANGFKGCKYAYSFAIMLIGNGRSSECFDYFVDCAQADQENVFLKNGLLGLLHDRPKPTPVSPASWPVLPEPMVASPLKLDFESADCFPPLLITDEEFSDCQAVTEVAFVVRGLPVDPISSWRAEIGALEAAVPERPGRGEPLATFNGEEVAQNVLDAFQSAPTVGAGAGPKEDFRMIGCV
jgi:hypothetical protein